MNKDILLLVTNEVDWQTRHARATEVLQSDIKVVYGESTILESFRKCAATATTDLYTLIDGDNLLLPNAKDVLAACSAPTVFYTTNKFGVTYGHGGVKVVNRHSNLNFNAVVDVTAKLGLAVDHQIISYHDFGFDPFNEWKTIFKEELKLFLWGNKPLLRQWLAHPLPLAIFKADVRSFLKTATMASIQETIFSKSKLQSLYEQSSHSRYL